jgi:hypothetical protein
MALQRFRIVQARGADYGFFQENLSCFDSTLPRQILAQTLCSGNRIEYHLCCAEI